MHHLSRFLVVLLLSFSVSSAFADEVDFSAMSLEELQSYETENLPRDQAKAHKKALKKAEKAKRKEARKNNPQKAYCSRSAKARGACY